MSGPADPWASATQLRHAIRTGSQTCEGLMQTTLERIHALNPRINAIINPLDDNDALALARQADADIAAGRATGPLHGLPMCIKDLVEVEGFPATMGFAPFAEHYPARDAEMVRRLRAAGALIIGKTNTPEFGLGSHTFNALFGTTANPYAADRTAGGSSGGAAAALASGMLSLADGSDMGGSLRNPASYCNVVGFRPSIGRVPDDRPLGWFARLSTLGPMARTVEDVALLLSVQTGQYLDDPRFAQDPLTAPITEAHAGWLPGPATPLRVAVAEDLGGLPIDPAVRTVIREAAQTFATLGATVDIACPDLSGAMDVFQTQRAATLAVLGRSLDKSLPNWRDSAKDTAVWNIEKGFALTGEQLLEAEVARTRIFRNTQAFFEHWDVLLCPAAQVPPFDTEREWVDEIEGVQLDTYIDWMTVCCAITVTGAPAISVPAGFTADGLPVGAQLVGAPGADVTVLRAAHTFEAATHHHKRHPQVG